MKNISSHQATPMYYFGTVFLLSLCFLFIGCNAGKDQTSVELIQDMMWQKSLKSQGYDRIRNVPANLVPPAGTVARGTTPYKYAGKFAEAEAKLVNPLISEKELQASLILGEKKFNIYCSVCHGVSGHGDGKVAPYFPLKPPPLITDKVKAFKDGRIFHIITDGQGIMSSYASQIPRSEDRWAIVNYIRTLQKK